MITIYGSIGEEILNHASDDIIIDIYRRTSPETMTGKNMRLRRPG
jgi:hypothetical protein